MSLCIFLLLSICGQFYSVVASYSCKTNEVYSNCMLQEELTCENWAHPIRSDDCLKGCFCVSGYVRDENNRCILKKDCPKPPNCKRHERFYQIGDNISTCLDPMPKTIKEPNCYCHVGFVKDTTNDVCVRWQNCPCFKPNQVYSECVPQYPKSCSHRSNNTKHDICLPNRKGCVCRNGFVLNKTDDCIPPKECPPTICQEKCGKHEKYVTCIEELRCNMTRTQMFAKCKTGCQCNHGYARDPSGRCIKLEKCECQENAEFVKEPPRCPRMCANMYNNEPPCEGVVPGACECKPGYVLDTQGDCILEEECKTEQVICPNNMIYVTDGYGISCKDIYKTPVAKKQTGCICEDGLYHDEETSMCVVAEECTNSLQNQACRKKSDRLEYKACQYAGCVKTCDNPNVMYCTQGNCTSGCYCRNGYVQESYSDKQCVLVDECTCQENATYNSCAQPIPTTCATLYQRGRVQMTLCTQRCDCDAGYVLNKDNQCVLKKDCSPNEIKCNSNLILTLTGRDFYECGEAKPKQCEIGCICPDGMHYDGYLNKCVFPKECTGSLDNQKCAKADPYKEYREYMPSNCVPTCANPKPTMCNKFNKPGCYCKNGMVQVSEKNKTCVLAYECPVPPTELQCDNNLKPVSIGVMNFCNSTSKHVELGCVCPDKLFYDPTSNKCVQGNECSPPICSDPLKEYKTCQSSSCIPTCENPSPTVCTMDCRNGCFCKDEYVQVSFENKTCVPLGDCLCGANATWKKCTTPCRKTCASAHTQKKCVVCHDTPQCECLDGYVLNTKNECVLIEECTDKDMICPPFMKYSTCHGCERSCNDLDPACTKQCRIGCACIDGYVLNSKGVCIPEAMCPHKPDKCKGPHEQFKACKNPCPETCATIFQPPRPCPRMCMAGCDCIDGYIRNSKGICIKPENCQPNEYVCPPFMNPVHKQTMFTTCTGTKLVNKGCVCKGKLAYNKWTKTCVNKSTCPEYLDKGCKLRDSNSQYSTCPACPQTCQHKNRICSMACIPGCECKDNYILSEDGGKCILPSQCPTTIPITCGENSVYSACKDTCPRTCENLYTGKPKFCTKICMKGCNCLDGYVKRSDGVCVKPKQCPIDEIICPLKMVATERAKELNTCETHFDHDASSSSDESRECTMTRCVCEKGLVYDNSTNACVYPRMCPNSPQNKECREFDENSVYSISHDCEHSCTDTTATVSTCEEECICKPGYVRDPDWKCVPFEKCPIDCGANATYRMFGIGCGDRCENHRFVSLILCMPIYKPGCYCNSGYVFNSANKCVLYEDCTPEEIQCGLHENQHYEETTRPRTCSELLSNKFLFRKGCFCPDGMVVNESTMECVEMRNCPATCSDPNKEFTCHPSSCTPTCDRYNFTICTTDCRPGCYCKRGLVQVSSKDNTCVSISECGKYEDTCPVNASLKHCTSNCTKTCANAHLPCPIVCHDEPKCECDPGYVLNDNGECVLYEDCGRRNCKCGKNMIYSRCHGCERTCYNMHPSCTKECNRGCFCKPGYILNYLGGECIPDTDCDQICSTNEVYKECKNHCPTTCANMQEEQQYCIYECTAGCDCADGFVRNSAGLCVSPNECGVARFEGSCKRNLVYSSSLQELNTCEIYFGTPTDEPVAYIRTHCVCEYGKLYDVRSQRCILATECPQSPVHKVCRKPNSEFKYCQSSTQPTCKDPHPFAVTADCTNGCFCLNGYVLDDNQNCILPQHCSSTHFCPENQTYTECKLCGNNCATQYLDVKFSCTCAPDCQCANGYIQEANGNRCVLPEDCDPKFIRCPLNEVYSECHPGDRKCDFSQVRYDACQRGCFCLSGYVRNADGVCIRPHECLTQVCATNETLSDCKGCGRTCGNYYLNIMFKCACIPGCACKEGYIRNAEKICIKIEDCTEAETVCQDNQHFCKSEVRRTCANPWGGDKTSGCFCDSDLILDESKRTCVDPRECETSAENIDCQRKDENSEFKTCQPFNYNTCDGVVYSNGACQPKCYCKPGYMENKAGKCVANCADICPPHSHYTDCINHCGQTCKSIIDNRELCSGICESEGCQCDNGYLLDDDGMCVSQEGCLRDGAVCGPQMRYYECNRNVIRTCQDKRIAKIRDIELIACRRGCFCEEPNILDMDSGKCVPPKDCPNLKSLYEY